MKILLRLLVVALAVLAAAAQAHPRGHWQGHGHGHWRFGAGFVFVAPFPYYYGYPYGYAPVPYAVVAEPVPPLAPSPVIQPRNGQSAAQAEADWQACNRQATTQPEAMADAAAFQRSVAACLDARGYTLR